MTQIVPISPTRLVSLIYLLLYLSTSLAAGGVRDTLWVTDGPVYTSLAAGDYNGGPVGSGVVIDTQTVLLDTQYPLVSGRINTVVPDGAGGWYIGGAFTMVSGVARENIAHINADKRVDIDWNPGANGEVRSLAFSGDGAALYVGGDFSAIGTLGRNRLARLSTATGNADAAWNPGADGSVRVLVLSGDGAQLYVGGDFTSIGGMPRNRLAALEISSADVISSWNPGADGRVLDMTLSGDGNTLYVGGEFLNVGGLSRNRIAALDAGSGAVDASWNPDADAAVRALGFSSSDSQLYVGGSFTSIGGAARNRIASINTLAINADQATAWNPDADGQVNTFVLSGDTLYVGGDFSVIGGQARSRLAAVNITIDSNNTEPWDPGVDNTVNSMALVGSSLYAGGGFSIATDRSTLYLGGDFTYVGPSTGGGIAINADPAAPASDRPDSAYPAVNGAVYAVAPDGAGGWYIGGQFSRVGNIVLNNIAHINSDLTVDAAWNPNTDGAVRALLLSGTTLYVGGDFTGFDGGVIARNYIAALDITTNITSNIPTAWNPAADGVVRTLQLSGTTLYVGGDFTGFDGGAITRNYIAALDTTTNITASIPTAWNPAADGVVRTLQLSGTTLYVGGDFTGFDGSAIARSYIAALDTTTTITANIPTAWNPDADGVVRTLQLSGTTLYVGGDFTGFDGGAITRNYIAALDTIATITANIPTAWNPDVDGAARALQLSGTTLFAGGDFTTVSGVSRSRLVALTADPAIPANDDPTAWNPAAGGSVHALALSGASLYAGGEFASVGGVTRSRLAALSLNNGQATGWNPAVDGIVRSMIFSGNAATLYVGGDFSIIGSQLRSRVAELDAFSGLPTFWNPAADATVTILMLAEEGESIYAGGAFSVIGGQPRNRLAEIRPNGTATFWMPELSGSSAAAPGDSAVYTLVQAGTTLYVGGDFAIVGSANHMGVVALDTATASATNWAPQVAGVVRAMNLSVDGSTLYIGGEFTAVGSDGRSSIAALSTSSNLATTWDPQADGDVLSMAYALDRASLYVGGDFSMIGGRAQNRLAALTTADGMSISSWNHPAGNVVRSVALSGDGNTIYAAGDFSQMDDLARGRIAALDALPLETDAPFTTATPAGGEYNGITNEPVVLACDDGAGSGCAATYFTSDGTTPTTDSTLYTEPIELASDTTLKYFSVDNLGNAETVNADSYVLELLAPVTTASPATGVFSSRNLEVVLTCVDDASGCAQTFYSKNEDDPIARFIPYGSPITISGNVTLRFYSTDLKGNVEVVQRENYVTNNGGGAFSLWLASTVLLLLIWRRAGHGRRRPSCW